MMTYGRIKAAERARQLLEQPRNLALTGPLVSIIINASLALAGVAGLFMAAQGLKAGPTVVLAAMVWASAHSVIVRMRNGTDVQLPDERERTNATNAAVVGSNFTVMLLGSWFLLLGVFADHGMWSPKAPEEWDALGFFVIGLTLQITNIAAAWQTPAYSGDLMDQD
jgi:hypothetical protein